MFSPILMPPFGNPSSPPPASPPPASPAPSNGGGSGAAPSAPPAPAVYARPVAPRPVPVQAATVPGSMEQRILAAFASLAQGIAAGAPASHEARGPGGAVHGDDVDPRLAATVSRYFAV